MATCANAIVPDAISLSMRLGFTRGAEDALYYDQALQNPEALSELIDTMVSEICNAVRRPGGAAQGHAVALILASRMKLVAFYTRHRLRNSRALPGLCCVEKIYDREYKSKIPEGP